MIDQSRLGTLRKHQARALVVAREYVAGRRSPLHQKVVVAGVTPGGGKTLMASLFANELADHGVIEQVVVVVPNDALRKQMRESFHDANRGLHRYLKQPTGEAVLPGMGQPFGIVVTYHSLASDVSARRVAKLVRSRPTLVIFDECHHLCQSKAWERGASVVAEGALLVLSMSGTLWRWDEERIPFVNYDDANVALVDIRYSRADALSERAVLPVEFRFFDGEAIYEHRKIPHASKLSSAPLKEQARALKTALLSADYSQKFLEASMKNFEQYRGQYYPSQAIGVFHDKKSTRRACAWGRHAFPKLAPVLSLCDESGSDKAIKNFRIGLHPVLFTVKKAYEGLDVPPATHLFYLGDVRSWPFLDQVIARVTRWNNKAPLGWEEQRGYVFMPDDKLSRDYVDNMMDEQAEYFREKDKGLVGTGTKPKGSSFRPDKADVTDIGFGLDGRVLSPEENVGIRTLEAKFPQMRAPLTDKLEIARGMGLIPLAPGSAA